MRGFARGGTYPSPADHIVSAGTKVLIKGGTMTIDIIDIVIMAMVAIAQVVALIVVGLSLIAVIAEIVVRVHNRKEEERRL